MKQANIVVERVDSTVKPDKPKKGALSGRYGVRSLGQQPQEENKE